ncbi:uncharacterized protein LOC129583191 [Paramacrobiotus metropolitanus]|uniref:uncharacterized protein LOC129583191 n=1 Tax=Paramacrobiotus metropolitanus TaxID=2943436 RepID=UPI0024458E9E|nr:uncharacterized protein LOC129583191 [Paramacrobiotus metropolitanus]
MDILRRLALAFCICGLITGLNAGNLEAETNDLKNTVDDLEPSLSSNLYTALSQNDEFRAGHQTADLPTPVLAKPSIQRPTHKKHPVHEEPLPHLNDQSDVSRIVPTPTARVIIDQHEEVAHSREKRCFTCGPGMMAVPANNGGMGNMMGNGGAVMGNDIQPDGRFIQPVGVMTGSSSGSFSGMSESSGASSADFARILQMFGGGSASDSFSQTDFARILNSMGSQGSNMGSRQSVGMSSGFQASSLSQSEINQILNSLTGMTGTGSSGSFTKGDFARVLINFGSTGSGGSFSGSSGSVQQDMKSALDQFGSGSSSNSFSSGSSNQQIFAKILQSGSSDSSNFQQSGMSGQKVFVQPQPVQVVVQPQPVQVVQPIPIRIVSGGNDAQPVGNDIQPQQVVNVNQNQNQYQQQQYSQQQVQQQQQYQQSNQYQQQNVNQQQYVPVQQPNKLYIKQAGGSDGYMVFSTGTYTLAGAMSTQVNNGYTYTMSTYTRIIDAIPTVGVITLVPVQTYYAGRLIPQGQNAYGVPNVGTFTLAGSMSYFQSQGYPYTVSSFTRIVDGAATYGAITLAGLQTYFNNRLLQPGQNPYGVPNVGTYTLNGDMQTIMISGYPATVSTYTRIVDGVATYGTITLGQMQTFYNNRLLPPGTNPYGVPNEGTYTLAGAMTSFADSYGYPVTVSSYTKVINGRATFGAVTKGTQMTVYNGQTMRYGENIFGVPNQGVYTIPGGLSYVDVNGQTQTRTTVTKIVNGQPTYVTLTVMPMQTIFVPNDSGQTMFLQGGGDKIAGGGGVCQVCG